VLAILPRVAQSPGIKRNRSWSLDAKGEVSLLVEPSDARGSPVFVCLARLLIGHLEVVATMACSWQVLLEDYRARRVAGSASKLKPGEVHHLPFEQNKYRYTLRISFTHSLCRHCRWSLRQIDASELEVSNARPAVLLRPSPSIRVSSTGFLFAVYGSLEAWCAKIWSATNSIPPSFHLDKSTQSSTTNKTRCGYTYFLFAICAAVAAFGFSSMAALPVSQVP